jgi:epoxyqueuosine reductase
MATPLFQFVQLAAVTAGFERVGVAPASHPEMRELQHFIPWIEAGYAGEMEYLKRRNEKGEYKRRSVDQALPWAKSVIVAAMNYNSSAPKSIDSEGLCGRGRGWISRYAMSPHDYHETVLGALRQVESALLAHLRETGSAEVASRCYVDTGPVLERVYAKYAGIGWIGKNTCIIDEKLGSWMFLGVIVTSLDLSLFSGEALAVAANRCGTCTRCIDACPTQAIVAPGELNASRCISYFTIEKRGVVPQEMRPKIGRHVFGCDICQDVCPWNRKAPVSANPALQPDPELIAPELSSLARMDAAEFRRRFRGSPISRTKHSGILRNVAITMGNSGNRDFIPDLEHLAHSEDEAVAEHARWAMEKLLEVSCSAEYRDRW